LARRLRLATREDGTLGSGRVGLPGSSDAGFHTGGSLPESVVEVSTLSTLPSVRHALSRHQN